MPTAINSTEEEEEGARPDVRVYAAEDISYYFQEHGGRGAVFVRCQFSCNVFKKGACLQTKELILLVSYQITCESIGKATVKKSQIQIHHQQSLVIGSLAQRESIFCQTDEALYVLQCYYFHSQHSCTSIFPDMLLGLELGNCRYRFP